MTPKQSQLKLRIFVLLCIFIVSFLYFISSVSRTEPVNPIRTSGENTIPPVSKVEGDGSSKCPKGHVRFGEYSICNLEAPNPLDICFVVAVIRSRSLKFVEQVLESTTCSVHVFLLQKQNHPIFITSNNRRVRITHVENESSAESNYYDFLRGTVAPWIQVFYLDLDEEEIDRFATSLENGMRRDVAHFIVNIRADKKSLGLARLAEAPLTLLEKRTNLLGDDKLEVLLTFYNPQLRTPAPEQPTYVPYNDTGKVNKEAWESIVPRAVCPQTATERIGGTHDGGKWVCQVRRLPPNCVVYSFGVNRDSSFEAELLNKTNCFIYAFDPGDTKIGAPVDPKDPRVVFTQAAVGPADGKKVTTIKSIMEKYGHEWIDLVKMDIEQGEYGTLEKVMEDFEQLPIGQLNVEMHVWDWKTHFAQKVYPLFNKLMARGLLVFHSEANPIYSDLCWEFSFLNVRIYPDAILK